MKFYLKGLVRVIIFPIFILFITAFCVVGCSRTPYLGQPVAIQIKKSNGEYAWRKNASSNIIGRIIIESPDLRKLDNPADPSLSHIPIIFVPIEISSFGKWKTADDSKFIIDSSIKYDKTKNIFILIDPIFTTSNGSDSIQLITYLENGEKITVKVPNGEKIKNNHKIGVDGSIK